MYVDRRDYQHQYYLARKQNNARLSVITTGGYIPPRVRSSYKIRSRRPWSGKVFRMASFSGDTTLKLMVRPR